MISGWIYLLDFERSTEIWNNLNIYNLNEKIENKRRNWYENVLRMDENRLPKT
jgi:hypothetical protein